MYFGSWFQVMSVPGHMVPLFWGHGEQSFMVVSVGGRERSSPNGGQEERNEVGWRQGLSLQGSTQ
jgi:hypothetical protein